jgi:hypothetical protein
MRGWQPANRTEWYRLIAILTLLVTASGGVLVAASGSASGTASMNVGNFTVDGVNKTTTANVSDVMLGADVNYEYDVADAEDVIVRLKVGPKGGDRVLVNYEMMRDVPASDSGTVTLSGSVLQHESLEVSDFQPGLTETATRELVVEAVVEVTRANGETVTRTVTDSVTVTVRDGTEFEVSVGGSGSVSVETEA